MQVTSTWRAAVRSFTALIALVALCGCTALTSLSSPKGNPGATGSVAVTATISPQSAPHAASGRITATNGGLFREAVVPVTNGTLSASFSGLLVGDWLIAITLMDDTGDTTHVAETAVRVFPGASVSAHLVAEPLEGQIEIVADLNGIAEFAEAQNARVSFQSGNTMTLKATDEDPMVFRGARELPPGDYDFSISLYKETVLVADRIYIGPWTSVRIEPGKTTRVTWQGETGSTEIETSIVNLPETPRSLAIAQRDGEDWLIWSIVGDAPQAFRVYHQVDMLASYKEVAEVPGDVFELALAGVVEPTGVGRLAVTAVSEAGREGYRSDPVDY